MPSPKKHVLVVDDDILMRREISTILKKFDFDVTEAVNGQDGVDKFQQQKFDLVTMDFMMPGLNGAEAAAKIRELDKTVMIIGLSSSYRRMEVECKKLNVIIPILSKLEMPDILTNFLEGREDGRTTY